jgi:hypothetical protein
MYRVGKQAPFENRKMLKKYVDLLLQDPENNGVLQSFRDQFPFQQYAGSDEYLSELDRLTNHNHYDGSVVDIIGDRSSIILIDDDRFTVSLSKRNSCANYVYTQPAEVLIVSLSHPDTVEIEQFWGDGVAHADPLSARSKKLSKSKAHMCRHFKRGYHHHVTICFA